MTFETPLHVHGIGLKRQGHLIHAAVTTRTPNALMNVNTVVEIGERRQVVYACPDERLAGAKARPHRLKHWTVGPDL